MFFRIKSSNFYIVCLLDLIFFSIALFGGYVIRFEFVLSSGSLDQIASLLPGILILKFSLFWVMGLYKGMYRYTGVEDIWSLFKATMLSTLLIMVGVLLIHRFQGYSRTIFLIDGILTFLFCGGFRFAIRLLFKEYALQNKNGHNDSKEIERKLAKPILIYGAGSSGEKILRELKENSRYQYKVVGFLDDDEKKVGRAIHGIPVIGSRQDLVGIKGKYKIAEIFITLPASTGLEMRAIVEECKKCSLPFKTLPGLGELIDGKVKISALRDVKYQDLLRREPVKIDSGKVNEYLNEKIVLVTGAGGSIGSELCRQIIKFQPRQLILLDASEPSLYKIQMELKHRAGYQRYSTILGFIQDSDLIDKVLQSYKPNVIFHAAAYKHVPMLERNPWQAVTNNIEGTRILLEKSQKYKVGHFVLVSTDKAVRPTNIMGASKRVCELLVQSRFGNGTKMMAVRFGNVVGSSGSVIPLFREQIERGGPVTVTHPEVTRFFMSIPEAAQLILQAGAQGRGGETFVLEMGVPIKIADMAKDLIRLSGKEPDIDIEIQYTGLRQGEKLYEELITADEGVIETPHEKIMVLKPNDHWNGHGSQNVFRHSLMVKIDELNALAKQHDICGIQFKMKEIVPEYDIQNSACVFNPKYSVSGIVN
ncbi:polysaccharide biosynthesis protein [Desulfospira joergensenii]|uniref:polysaccharide biosynthesis protein n=1 Tax=Desulfospira joergensenii TaxID=53329 RepID=UPI000424DF94|nr:nucleoside-diphosphate sugar epimerase/dehydratase [Desulfospira joergensenii]